MPEDDVSLIDADNHYYERPDCFSRHIEAAFADRCVRAEQAADGDWEVTVAGRPYNFMHVKFDATNQPGSLYEVLRAADGTMVDWGSSYTVENMLPAYQERDARLDLLDEQGIGAALLFPTFGVSVEDYLVDDVDATYANLRSFNRWLEDDWGYAYAERLFCPPLLSLLDVDQAVTELDRVLDLGARVVHLRPTPRGQGNRSIAHPHFDPFWARLDEASVPVAFHIADFRYPEAAALVGDDPLANVREMSAFQWAFLHGDRPIMETFGALLFGNIHSRFPNLRFVSIENGSDWVPYLLNLLDKKKNMARYGPWPGGRPSGKLSEAFRTCCFVSPYPEDDVEALVDVLGASQVLFGSDHPHPEGLAVPGRFADLIARRDPDEIDQVMVTNTAGLLALDV